MTSRPTRPIPGSPVLASRSRRVLQGSAALVAVALLAACTQAPDQGTTATPTTTPSGSSSSSPSTGDDGLAQFYEQKIAWKSCGGSFRCADLTVPLDYTKPDGDTLAIALIKLPATDDANRIGSLVLNPGGPGGSGVDYARAARAVVDEKVRDVYDVVGTSTGPMSLNWSPPIAAYHRSDASIASSSLKNST